MKVKVQLEIKVKVSPRCKEIVPLYSEHRSSSTQRHLEYADQGKYLRKYLENKYHFVTQM